MTHIQDGVLIIKPEPPQQCDQCGKIAELRPYGKGGACICFECGNLDVETTTRNMLARNHGIMPGDAVGEMVVSVVVGKGTLL